MHIVRRKQPIRLKLTLAVLTALLAVTGLGPVSAATLATFECQEITGRDWVRTLVTYPLELKAGQARPGAVRLTDGQGLEVPCQLSRLTTHADGSIATARISFYAGLPNGGGYRLELTDGKSAAGKPPRATMEGRWLTLDNGPVAIRLPAGKKQFAKPLSLAGDRALVMQNLDRLEQKGLAFGPIAGVRLADGRWVGSSYFAMESIETVRFRQKNRETEPDATTLRAAWEKAPKVTGYETRITEQGPLFAEAKVRFSFDNGGFYEMTVRALADDPALRIDEVMDLKTHCPGDDPLCVAVLLNDGWKSGGWKPDAAFFMTTRRTDKFEPLEAALQSQGFQSRYASVPVDYSAERALVTEVVPHDCWSERAHYLGLVESARLRETKTPRFLGVVPLHAGTWRAAHWVFPPRSPFLFQQVLSYRDGSLELRWTLRAQPHPQNLLHTGEYDPDFGLTGVRRLWALVGGPFQYHDTLHPFRNYEGSVNLDNYKDWNLAWSDETRAVRSSPPTQEDLNSPPIIHLNGAFVSDDREYAWFSHYRQAEKLTWAVDLRRRLEQPGLSPAERGRIQRNIAAFCYFMAEPDFNTRASMTHQGNPNMPVNRFFALPFAAALIPDHPLAKTWTDVSAAYVRYKAGGNTAPLGAWSELITYYAASAPTVMHGALVAKQAGRLDDSTATLATGPMDFTLKLLSPVDPRFNARIVPGFGHEGALMFNQWTPAASLIRHLNPELAAAFLWAWDQQKRPGSQQHDNGFTHLTANQTDLLDKATPEVVRQTLASSWLPGFGATLRAFPGDPNETYLACRQGYLASHSDANQGDFVIYAKGAPLTVMSLAGYAIHSGDRKNLFDEFGWHSRVRFGKQSDSGGWPGGGPASGVHRHFFSASADYLRGMGDYSPRVTDPKIPFVRDLAASETVRWTRQILFLKDKQAAGPNYFVFRDSFRNRDTGDKTKLPQTWWYQRTLGSKQQVQATDTGFDYSSQWGQKMNTHFLHPARVQMESREVTAPATLYNQLARTWLAAGTPVARKEGEANATINETITVNAAGPISPGEDVMVAVYPQGRDEAAPKYEVLSDGVARITTASATDYVFASLDGVAFTNAEVAFNGVAGAVRVFPDEVHLIVLEGAGTVRYQRCTLHAGQPVTRVVPIAEISRGASLEVPAAKVTLSFDLDENAAAIEQLAPGVRKQTLTSGVAFEFNTPQPIRFAQDQVVFVGRRGGIRIDTTQKTVRLVLLDGQKIGYGPLQADVGTGPCDLTFHHDKVVGVSEGPGRFIHMTMPEGIVQLPALRIDGIGYAPGTYGQIAIVPVLDGRCEFTLENLPQPPVFRSWQLW